MECPLIRYSLLTHDRIQNYQNLTFSELEGREILSAITPDIFWFLNMWPGATKLCDFFINPLLSWRKLRFPWSKNTAKSIFVLGKQTRFCFYYFFFRNRSDRLNTKKSMVIKYNWNLWSQLTNWLQPVF